MRVFRRICGLVAAYAVALQPLLVLTLTAATVRSSAGFEICARAADQPAAPAEHRGFECCLLMGCGSTSAAGADETVVLRTPFRSIQKVAADPVFDDFRPGWPPVRPPPARGPPV